MTKVLISYFTLRVGILTQWHGLFQLEVSLPPTWLYKTRVSKYELEDRIDLAADKEMFNALSGFWLSVRKV